MDSDSHTDEELRKFYGLENIAVVGMSKNEEKAASYVPKYLIDHGYNVIPVNPTASEILGKKCYERVSEIPDRIDIVDVFRPSDAVQAVIEDAIKKPGISLIWLQEGIHNEAAERMAIEKSISVVFNRCMMAEHRRLFEQ